MPQLIILLAWRLVIESFGDFWGLSSRCMPIGQTSYPAEKLTIYVKVPSFIFLNGIFKRYSLHFKPEIEKNIQLYDLRSSHMIHSLITSFRGLREDIIPKNVILLLFCCRLPHSSV